MRIKYSQGDITPEAVIKFISLTGQADAIIRDAIKLKEAQKKASDMGLSASGDELQQFADSFRKIHGLMTAEDTYTFLAKKGLTEDDFEEFCEESLMMERIKDHLSDENRIQEYFVNNRADFDAARISVIAVKDQNLADEIVLQVTDEGVDFHLLARKHSIDLSTKYAGGYIGNVKRKMLDPQTAAKVFNASPGEVIGPFNQKDVFQLIFVEEIIKAEMNEENAAEIKERLFTEWISHITKGGFEVSE